MNRSIFVFVLGTDIRFFIKITVLIRSSYPNIFIIHLRQTKNNLETKWKCNQSKFPKTFFGLVSLRFPYEQWKTFCKCQICTFWHWKQFVWVWISQAWVRGVKMCYLEIWIVILKGRNHAGSKIFTVSKTTKLCLC